MGSVGEREKVWRRGPLPRRLSFLGWADPRNRPTVLLVAAPVKISHLVFLLAVAAVGSMLRPATRPALRLVERELRDNQFTMRQVALEMSRSQVLKCLGKAHKVEVLSDRGEIWTYQLSNGVMSVFLGEEGVQGISGSDVTANLDTLRLFFQDQRHIQELLGDPDGLSQHGDLWRYQFDGRELAILFKNHRVTRTTLSCIP